MYLCWRERTLIVGLLLAERPVRHQEIPILAALPEKRAVDRRLGGNREMLFAGRSCYSSGSAERKDEKGYLKT